MPTSTTSSIFRPSVRCFPLPQVIVDWMLQICLGLQACHKKKILHRDIKPRGPQIRIFRERQWVNISFGRGYKNDSRFPWQPNERPDPRVLGTGIWDSGALVCHFIIPILWSPDRDPEHLPQQRRRHKGALPPCALPDMALGRRILECSKLFPPLNCNKC